MTGLRVMKSGNITWTNVDVDKNVIIMFSEIEK